MHGPVEAFARGRRARTHRDCRRLMVVPLDAGSRRTGLSQPRMVRPVFTQARSLRWRDPFLITPHRISGGSVRVRRQHPLFSRRWSHLLVCSLSGREHTPGSPGLLALDLTQYSGALGNRFSDAITVPSTLYRLSSTTPGIGDLTRSGRDLISPIRF